VFALENVQYAGAIQGQLPWMLDMLALQEQHMYPQ